jgi:hypothetical protein
MLCRFIKQSLIYPEGNRQGYENKEGQDDKTSNPAKR